jgi:hypothetical protein
MAKLRERIQSGDVKISKSGIIYDLSLCDIHGLLESTN